MKPGRDNDLRRSVQVPWKFVQGRAGTTTEGEGSVELVTYANRMLKTRCRRPHNSSRTTCKRSWPDILDPHGTSSMDLATALELDWLRLLVWTVCVTSSQL